MIKIPDHICTTESLFAGGIELGESKCPICCQETRQKAGYIGVYCYTCKNVISGEEWAGDIARYRRQILGMTKKEIGDKLSLSKHTIHSYEWRKCPEKYLDQLEALLKEKDSSESEVTI